MDILIYKTASASDIVSFKNSWLNILSRILTVDIKDPSLTITSEGFIVGYNHKSRDSAGTNGIATNEVEARRQFKLLLPKIQAILELHNKAGNRFATALFNKIDLFSTKPILHSNQIQYWQLTFRPKLRSYSDDNASTFRVKEDTKVIIELGVGRIVGMQYLMRPIIETRTATASPIDETVLQVDKVPVVIYKFDIEMDLVVPYYIPLKQYEDRDRNLLVKQGMIGNFEELRLLPACRFSRPLEEGKKAFMTECYCLKQHLVEESCSRNGIGIEDSDYDNLAAEIGCEKAVLLAIAEIEGKDAFIKGILPKHAFILLERHLMYEIASKKLTSEQIEKYKKDYSDVFNNNPGGYNWDAAGVNQLPRLKKAKEIDVESAIQSCSWGVFQVLGRYYGTLYSNPLELEEAQNMCARQQFALFRRFLFDIAPQIKKYLVSKNWNKIAEFYNGAKYAEKNYHTKLKDAYDRYSS